MTSFALYKGLAIKPAGRMNSTLLYQYELGSLFNIKLKNYSRVGDWFIRHKKKANNIAYLYAMSVRKNVDFV